MEKVTRIKYQISLSDLRGSYSIQGQKHNVICKVSSWYSKYVIYSPVGSPLCIASSVFFMLMLNVAVDDNSVMSV